MEDTESKAFCMRGGDSFGSEVGWISRMFRLPLLLLLLPPGLFAIVDGCIFVTFVYLYLGSVYSSDLIIYARVGVVYWW